MTYTAIFRLKTGFPPSAQEALDTFGEGGRPDSTQEETFFSLCNTPSQNGYFRMRVAEHIATALQWMQDNGMTSPNLELIRVEWHGQDIVEIDGEMVEQLFFVGNDTDGNPQYLGRIG